VNERPCKNCKEIKNDHVTLQYKCNVDRLAPKWSQIYYENMARNNGAFQMMCYEPMDNLEYLEWMSSKTAK